MNEPTRPDMNQEPRCPRCGRKLPTGQANCPACGSGVTGWFAPREKILVLSLLLLVVFFIFTGFAVRLYHAKQGTLATEWFRRGESAVRAGQAESAIEDLRTALVYSRDNPQYRLRLAQALIAANRLNEAQAHLFNLWEKEPGNGTINLELARLASRKGDVTGATRYFHNAIYGVWEADPETHRREARLELIDFWLNREDKSDAQAELIALSADLPRDAVIHAQVGDRFMKAEDYRRALLQFRQALRLDRKLNSAWIGAGEAAFQLGKYDEAQGFLEHAAREEPKNTRIADLLETTTTVLSLDPFMRGLSAQERSRRAVRAFELSLARLRTCAESHGETLGSVGPHTELQSAYAKSMILRRKVRIDILRRDPDLLASSMETAFENEESASLQCGTPTGPDLALLVMAHIQKGTEQ